MPVVRFPAPVYTVLIASPNSLWMVWFLQDSGKTHFLGLSTSPPEFACDWLLKPKQTMDLRRKL